MKPEIFGFIDIIIGFGWLMIIIMIGFIIRIFNRDKAHYKYFMPNLYFKLFFGVLFALAYGVVLSEGGDTLAYWDGAVKLNHLFWESPFNYFEELFTTPSQSTITERFNLETGYPPSWIYKEHESWFVSKVLSVFTFITFNSYLALTLIFGFISALASWRFYQLVKDFKFCPEWVLLVASLFIPTVAFWCSGISKDTLTLAALYFLIYHLFSIIRKDLRFGFYNVLVILFYVFILYSLRPFMIIALFVPLSIAIGARFLNSLNSNSIITFSARTVLYGLVIAFLLSYLGIIGGSFLSENPYLEEVAIIQRDFAENKLYTGYRYDLGITDYSPVGMLSSSPIAIITAFFRPFIWEANSAFLLISGVEGALLLYFVFTFFFKRGNLLKHFKFIRSQEFLVFSIVFVLLMGFFVGFTSGLFNVLVRFKAPLMAFLFIFFSARNPEKTTALQN
ncbi:MAG: hypothetical protein WED10_00965 [Brumimicrobium sp.]